MILPRDNLILPRGQSPLPRVVLAQNRGFWPLEAVFSPLPHENRPLGRQPDLRQPEPFLGEPGLPAGGRRPRLCPASSDTWSTP